MKLAGVLVITLGILTWGSAVFDMDYIPWADVVNATTLDTGIPTAAAYMFKLNEV